jgi:hypothetical protein
MITIINKEVRKDFLEKSMVAEERMVGRRFAGSEILIFNILSALQGSTTNRHQLGFCLS